jgi:hypothetical protein
MWEPISVLYNVAVCEAIGDKSVLYDQHVRKANPTSDLVLHISASEVIELLTLQRRQNTNSKTISQCLDNLKY